MKSVARALNAAISGRVVTQLRDDIYLIDVIARAIGEERISLPTLRTLQVPLRNGRTVALGAYFGVSLVSWALGAGLPMPLFPLVLVTAGVAAVYAAG